ncbi:Hypothetical predicted protein [Marmota monax]|uniref:Uncharacterized protein n=1 Tax=Marmota monax TaxID=9995 RepID=A0A5E4BQF7_MARMO|nr:hypothetical protein GHT09_009436 [Marmota monax]VTJ71496.1 Hypothetical predicted protein [Marmota monax]
MLFTASPSALAKLIGGGCGTGKYLKVNSQVHTLGCDYCGPLVEIARSRGCEVMLYTIFLQNKEESKQ